MVSGGLHILLTSTWPHKGAKPRDFIKASSSSTDCVTPHVSQGLLQPGTAAGLPTATWRPVESQTTVVLQGGSIQKVNLSSSWASVIA